MASDPWEGCMITLSKELVAAIRPQKRLLKLIWVGIFPTFGIYSYLAWLRSKQAIESASASNQLLIMAGMMGIMMLVLSLALRWFSLSPRAIANVARGKPSLLNNLLSGNTQRPVVPVPEGLSEAEQRLYAYSRKSFVHMLICWGLLQNCALFGMILPPVQYQPMASIVAGLLSAGCMFFHFPRIQPAFVAGLELAEFEGGLYRD